MAINLPEKDYFAVDEIRGRWNIDEGTFWHYVKHQKLLRVALPAIDGLSCIRADDLDHPGYQSLIDQAQNFREPCDDAWLEKMIREAGTIFGADCFGDAELRPLPAFLYPANPNVPDEKSEFFTDYAGDLYLFADEIVDGGRFRNTIVHLEFGEHELVVERQERDRFEAKYNDQSGNLVANHPENPASLREASNRLRLIGMMLELLTHKDKARGFSSQEQLATYLEKEAGNADGMSTSNLKQVFAQANKVVRGKI
jgi:hypothetical protein